MLNLRSETLKITSSKVFLIPLKIWSLILKATYEPLCELEYQTSTWIYLTPYAFLFTGQLSGIFRGSLFQQKILKLKLLWALICSVTSSFHSVLKRKYPNLFNSSVPPSAKAYLFLLLIWCFSYTYIMINNHPLWNSEHGN